MYFARQANFNSNNSNPRSNPEISLGGKGGGKWALAVSARLRGLVYFLPLNLSRTSGRVEYKMRPRSGTRVPESRDASRRSSESKFTFSSSPGFRAFIIPSRICVPLSSIPSPPAPSDYLSVGATNGIVRTCSQRDVIRKQRALLHRAIASVDGGIIFALLPSRQFFPSRWIREFATKIASRPHHIYRTDFPVITFLPPFCVK